MRCGKTGLGLTLTMLCLLAGTFGVPVENSRSKAARQARQTEQLDSNGDYLLSWTIDEESSEIVFEVEARTLGYVGLGLSPKGNMDNADIFIAGVDTRGVPKIYYGDYHGVGSGPPAFDVQQDWTLLEAKENATHTYIKVSRLLDTCDNDDYPITEENTARVIWSLGATDDVSYHGTNRGTESINLITVPEPEVDVERLMKWNMIVNTTMPPADTTYWCTIHKRPPLSGRRHVVGFDALLDGPVAVQHTHHFIVSKCTAPPGMNASEIFEPFIGHPGDTCFGESTPIPADYCEKYLFVWAVGGKRTLFPLEAGYSIGVPEQEDFYYMLEVHYDNPNLLEGIQFNTGIQIYYTDELRPREAVMFAIGHDTTPSLMIPPNQTDFVIAGHCAPSCTKRLPPTGIKVFNVLLHSHISGRKLKLRHFRGKEELKWLAFDDNYDFDFQQNRALREEIVIQPGDHFTFECTYDSRWKNGGAVTGGLSSRQEMCLAFLWTYTDSDEDIAIDTCHSHYSIDQTMLDFGITNWTRIQTTAGPDALIYEPPEMAGMLFADAISNVFQWTPAFIEDQQRKHRYGVQLSACCDRTIDECESGIIMYPDAVAYSPEPTCQ